MKTLLLFIGIFSILNANDWITSYEKLYQRVEDGKVNKPIFLIVGSSSCHYCKKEMEILKEEDIKTFLFDNFTPAYVEQDRQFVPVDYMSEYTPTIFILSNKTLLPLTEKAVGAIPKEKLKGWLERIVEVRKLNEHTFN